MAKKSSKPKFTKKQIALFAKHWKEASLDDDE